MQKFSLLERSKIKPVGQGLEEIFLALEIIKVYLIDIDLIRIIMKQLLDIHFLSNGFCSSRVINASSSRSWNPFVRSE